MSTLKEITLNEARKFYTGFEVKEARNGYTLIFDGTVSAPLRLSEQQKVSITIPRLLLPSTSGDPLWPFKGFQTPYGREITLRVAGSVFHLKWDSRELVERFFGILPGAYYYLDGNFHFDVELDPSADNVDALLFYTDRPVHSSARSDSSTTTFNLGGSGLYGMVLPINFLTSSQGPFGDVGIAFSRSNHMALRGKMSLELATYLERMDALATIA